MMKLRKIIIMAFSFIAIVSLMVGVRIIDTANVKAASLTTATFTMENGAAARINTLTDENGNAIENNGLRFSAEISPTEFTALKEAGAKFGMVIVAKDLVKTVEITEETVFGANPSFYFSNQTETANGKIAMLNVENAACADIDEDENIEICGSIVNLAVLNFTRSFIGRAYVVIPQTDESGAITGYSYQFAPYYDGNVANNTRCIYYVAQRAIEAQATNNDVLKQKYIDEFAKTERYTDYQYRYNVQHHYTYKNGEETKTYTYTESFYAQLNTNVSAEPVGKPTGTELGDLNFIFNVNTSKETQAGIVYAAGMQTLHLYYDQSSEISEEDKETTLDTVLEKFLSTEEEDVLHNFDVNTAEGGTWEAIAVTGDDGKTTGINLYTKSPNSDQEVTLSVDFFKDLYAYGVSTVSFSFYALKNGKNENYDYTMYKGNTDEKLPFRDVSTNDDHRVEINISDLMVDGVVVYSVRIDLGNSSSSKDGNYFFENVEFGFPTKAAAV